MNEASGIIKKEAPTFYFIGVTTRKSSIMKVFPLWMQVLGREEVVIEGVDLKIHDTPQAYRAATAQIKFDPLSLGALVTTHKVDLYHAARDMFDFSDRYAQITGEVSSISKLDGRLEGHAKDPITAGLSMDAIVGKDYFSRSGGPGLPGFSAAGRGGDGGHVLIFGAGGSSAATILHLIMREKKSDRPEKIIVVNRSPGRLETVRAMVDSIGTDIALEYICNQDPWVNDTIMAELPEGSIVINATGMGKDTPGSPVTDAGRFPRNGIAWEFNYRGELDFMHQALAQVDAQSLKVEDGWLYFIHGWTQVVAQVLHVDLTPDLFARLEAAAATVRA